MPGKTATPHQIAEVVALREAGYTVAMIADRTGLSASTVNRIASAAGAKKGAASATVLEQARLDLRAKFKSKDAIAEEAARLIADDLAQVRLLRERVVLASEHLAANDLNEAAIMMRAAAAMSTVLKNTSDMVRHSLGVDKHRDEPDEEDLPELVVSVIDDQRAREMNAIAANDEELDGDERRDATMTDS